MHFLTQLETQHLLLACFCVWLLLTPGGLYSGDFSAGLAASLAPSNNIPCAACLSFGFTVPYGVEGRDCLVLLEEGFFQDISRGAHLTLLHALQVHKGQKSEEHLVSPSSAQDWRKWRKDHSKQ